MVNPKEIPGQFISLTEIFKSLTFSPRGRALDLSVQQVNLGKFGEWADELSLQSLADPRGQERGRLITVHIDGRVAISKETAVGTDNNIGKSVGLYFPQIKDAYGVQLTRLGSILHSHGAYDYPPSPSDVVPILLNTNDIDSATCVFVATAFRKILVFRTNSTPGLTREQVNQIAADWTQLIVQEQIKYALLPAHVGVQWEQNHQERLFDRKARELGLAVFVALAEEQVAERVTSLITHRSLKDKLRNYLGGL